MGDWQYNPDVPTMKLYKCWDSSATISKNDTSRSVNITREGELSGKLDVGAPIYVTVIFEK